jgi:predicted ATPase/DNA-binding CsgD family transcriptional regulator
VPDGAASGPTRKRARYPPLTMRSGEFLERAPLLEALTSRLREARSGAGVMMLLGGEAGIGKTTLVRRFCQGLQADVRVLVGACDSMSTPRPLGPLLDMVPDLGEAFGAALDANRREAVFDLFLAALRPPAKATVVVLEDVHWADDATLDLLRFLGRRQASTRALTIVTYRDDEVGPRHPLRTVIGDLATSAAVARLTLPVLSLEAVARLARSVGGDAEAVHRTSGGNPFFVTELLAARGSVLPVTVRDAVTARAARLDEAARAALDTASVVGAPMDPSLLIALGASVEAIEACVASGMLQSHDEMLTFRHDLIREGVYRSLSTAHRRNLHRRVLAALETSPSGLADLAALAHHAAESADGEAVLRLAPAAARKAAQLGAHREAHAQYVRAAPFLATLPEPAQAELLEAFATECTIVDRFEESARLRRDVVERWQRLGRPRRAGLNLSLLAQAYVGLGRDADAASASAESVSLLERLEPGPELARAYWYDANIHMLSGDIDASLARGEQAIALARSLGEVSLLANAHMTVGSALLSVGRAGADEHLQRSLALAATHRLPNLVADIHSSRGSMAAECHRFPEAKAELEAADALADEHGHDNIRYYALAWLALIAVYRGDWSAAADTALRVAARPQLSIPARITALVALGRLRARRGDPEVAAALDEALALALRTGGLHLVVLVRAARAEAASLAGDAGAVGAEARAAYDMAARHRHPWFVGELGYWRWTVGDLSELPSYAAEPFALQVAGRAREAAAAWQALGCPYEHARALSESADEADLRAALAVFRSLGARAAATTTARLRNLGARGIPRGPRELTQQHPASLTPREAEVLIRLAQGLRNSEIAEQHRVSTRTVGHQVSSLMAKLDVRTRTEAVTEALRRGLLPRDVPDPPT